MNISAHRHGLGPNAVAREIRRLLQHDQTTIAERRTGSIVQLSKRDERIFRKMCKKLLKYARFVLQIFFCPLCGSDFR